MLKDAHTSSDWENIRATPGCLRDVPAALVFLTADFHDRYPGPTCKLSAFDLRPRRHGWRTLFLFSRRSSRDHSCDSRAALRPARVGVDPTLVIFKSTVHRRSSMFTASAGGHSGFRDRSGGRSQGIRVPLSPSATRDESAVASAARWGSPRHRITSSRSPPWPCTGQRQLWLFDQLYGRCAAYNVLVALHLRGRLEPEWLRRSLNEVVRRHESLRTTLEDEDGEVLQVIAPALVLDLPIVDLTDTVPGARLAERSSARRCRWRSPVRSRAWPAGARYLVSTRAGRPCPGTGVPSQDPSTAPPKCCSSRRSRLTTVPSPPATLLRCPNSSCNMPTLPSGSEAS